MGNAVIVGEFAISTQIGGQRGSHLINVVRMYYDAAGNSPDTEAARERLATRNVRPYVEDATFVKLRDVSLSYILPAGITAQLGPVKRLELSLGGQNLWTFTRYTGLDPEVSSALGRYGRHHDIAPSPPSRSYWLSIAAGI